MATSSSLSQCKERIRQTAFECGFDACGFAQATRVDDTAIQIYREWISEGKHDEMHYLANHLDLRDDPAALLPGTRTVISVALNYYPAVTQCENAPQFARYAYGKDYHEVVAERLDRLASQIIQQWECDCRRCVDTAPVRERYWAQQAGIGFVGRNNQLIIPGKGSYFFLGELLTTLELPPDDPCQLTCGPCRRCADSCPTGAIDGSGTCLDARLCISCATIEHRSALPEKVAQRLGNRVYGCDACQTACPHNRNAKPTSVTEFSPSEEFLSLSYESMSRMTEDDFRRIFRKSAVKRTKYSGLMRNLAASTAFLRRQGQRQPEEQNG